MIAYLDSSVLLRIVLREPGVLQEWNSIRTGVASAILEVECLRAIDRLRIRKGLTDGQVSSLREALYRLISGMSLVELDRPILARASEPLSPTLGTLDAIHLASALFWREQSEAVLTMATHDSALGLASRAYGFPVVGI